MPDTLHSIHDITSLSLLYLSIFIFIFFSLS